VELSRGQALVSLTIAFRPTKLKHGGPTKVADKISPFDYKIPSAASYAADFAELGRIFLEKPLRRPPMNLFSTSVLGKNSFAGQPAIGGKVTRFNCSASGENHDK
jgi:hypothetical protein